MKILVLNGINLNMLGKGNARRFGALSLAEIDERVASLGIELGVEVASFQTNDEGAMCRRIHQAFVDGVDAVLINAGAWTHYSYGIRDALAILKCPTIEVHLANTHAQEEFRHSSCFGEVVKAQVCGFGVDSYLLALRGAVAEVRAAKA